MGTTQPIRNKKELTKFVEYYRSIKPMKRNYALIVIGLYTALRISDILCLQWKDVYDFQNKCFFKHIFLEEAKTKKQAVIALNSHVKEALNEYRKERLPLPENYIFTKATCPEIPLSRSQAYRIVKKAALVAVSDIHISCHSLRKTFGYHAWKQGIPPAMLMELYNHSSYQVTKKYLGIGQDERDDVYLKIDF